jgi:hypothetical protein
VTVVLDARDRPVARKEALVRAHALGGLELVGGGVHGSLTAGAHLHMLIASFQAGHVATNDAAHVPDATLAGIPRQRFCSDTEAVNPVHPAGRFGVGFSDRLPERLGRSAELAPNVSNELSNYCGADRHPPLDDPGSFGAPSLAIDDHLTCFTPKQSETYAWFLRIAWGRSSELNQGNVITSKAAPPTPVRLLVNRSGAPRSSGYTHGHHLRVPPHRHARKRSLTRKESSHP